MILKKYQEEATQELLRRNTKLLNQEGLKKFVFQAPTGSGKTLITANFLKNLIENSELKKELSFVWLAPRDIPFQSKSKLEEYFQNSNSISCVDFFDLMDNQISENQILFLNWESINKEDNIYRKSNEKNKYLDKIIQNTKNNNRDILLIIDESHHHSQSPISQEVIVEIFSPKLIFEVSATPKTTDLDDNYKITLEEVKEEAMIKKSLIPNPEFENFTSENKLVSNFDETSNLVVLRNAINKRKEILKEFKREKIEINPLVLLQLPHNKSKNEDLIKEQLVDFLKSEFDISVENKRLAIKLATDVENFNNISNSNNETEVLIFKDAIALGWDCPRAHILVLLREWKSLSFSIQTIGRIMRMPEPFKNNYYDSELLNHCYLYTNVDKIDLVEDYLKEYLKVNISKNETSCKQYRLISYHSYRDRKKTRLNPDFVKIFNQIAIKENLKEKIDIKNQSIDFSIITNSRIENIDEISDKDFSTSKIGLINNISELQFQFDIFLRNSLSPFFPENRSIGKLKESLYGFFHKEFQMDYRESNDLNAQIIKIILSKKNLTFFSDIINETKEKYIDLNSNNKKKLSKINDWDFPKFLQYPNDFKKIEVKKSIMQPFYSNKKYKTETKFITLLENSNNVVWWFKNGEKDGTSFAIPYVKDDKERAFYVDFIVMLRSKKIGLFDTKSGFTIQQSKEKNDGLQKYIKNYNKLIGGIVTNTDKEDFSGRWVYYKGKGKDLVENYFLNWENISDLNI